MYSNLCFAVYNSLRLRVNKSQRMCKQCKNVNNITFFTLFRCLRQKKNYVNNLFFNRTEKRRKNE